MNAQQRVEAALYALTPKQREGLDASGLRNVLTDLWPAIQKEIEAAVLAEREDTAKMVEQMCRRRLCTGAEVVAAIRGRSTP